MGDFQLTRPLMIQHLDLDLEISMPYALYLVTVIKSLAILPPPLPPFQSHSMPVPYSTD